MLLAVIPVGRVKELWQGLFMLPRSKAIGDPFPSIQLPSLNGSTERTNTGSDLRSMKALRLTYALLFYFHLTHLLSRLGLLKRNDLQPRQSYRTSKSYLQKHRRWAKKYGHSQCNLPEYGHRALPVISGNPLLVGEYAEYPYKLTN